MSRSLSCLLLLSLATLVVAGPPARQPVLVAKPDAFKTLVNPNCSHCRDEAKRRAGDLRDDEPVLCWLRGYSDGGSIPFRFFLSPHRVISDTYGVFVYDPDAGFARAFAPSLDFRFHGWRNGVMVMSHKDGTLYSCLTGVAFDGPSKGTRLKAVPTLVSTWGEWLKRYPQAVAYHMFDKYQAVELPTKPNPDSVKSRPPADGRLPGDALVLGVVEDGQARAYPLERLARTKLLRETVGGKERVVVFDGPNRTGVAYHPVASPPAKKEGKPRTLTLSLVPRSAEGFRMVDRETGSQWDIAGRAVAGELRGWTLEWLEGTQVRWFAWAAEYPGTTIHGK
ncbi:MAG: DUF3179 domain-containing protein [Gemmataceae bacterium]|nr:DUF3179 domain-containing protein [Gemmataceae bacterium]